MKQRASFESHQKDRLSARITVQSAARPELTKQMRLLGHASTKQRCEIQCEALEFSDEQITLI